MPGQSPRTKLKKGIPLTGFANTLPVVSITASPASVVTAVPTGGFIATAVDAEQGDLAASIVWSTTIDGTVGTGSPATLTFTDIANIKTLTATVTDAFGGVGTATVNIDVTAT